MSYPVILGRYFINANNLILTENIRINDYAELNNNQVSTLNSNIFNNDESFEKQVLNINVIDDTYSILNINNKLSVLLNINIENK